jgi:hypothetical protein
LATGRSVALTKSKRNAIANWKCVGIPRATAGIWSRARKPIEAGAGDYRFFFGFFLSFFIDVPLDIEILPGIMIAAKAPIGALFRAARSRALSGLPIPDWVHNATLLDPRARLYFSHSESKDGKTWTARQDRC